jgi:hypothetical protein
MGSLISYKEIEVPGVYSQHIIFFITDELDQYARVLDYIWLGMFVRDNYYSLLDSQ